MRTQGRQSSFISVKRIVNFPWSPKFFKMAKVFFQHKGLLK